MSRLRGFLAPYPLRVRLTLGLVVLAVLFDVSALVGEAMT